MSDDNYLDELGWANDPDLVVEEVGDDEGVAGAGGGGGSVKEDEDDDDEFAASAEELEYERQDAAARPIQAMVRRCQGRNYARTYGKQVFIKEWDDGKRRFAYVDTRRSPPERYWTKPKWLGKDDLPEERVYKAPPGVARRQTQRQFALVSHTALYDDDKVRGRPVRQLRQQRQRRHFAAPYSRCAHPFSVPVFFLLSFLRRFPTCRAPRACTLSTTR